MIRPEDQARWAPCLLTGERLLWAGVPSRGLAFRWDDLYLVPASLAGAAGLLFAEFGFLRDEAPDLSVAWAIPLLLVALYIFPGRFLLDSFLRARTHYAVTNRRILALRLGPFGTLKSIDLDYLPTLELRERGDRGTLIFDPGEGPGQWGSSYSEPRFPTLRGGLQFYRIDRPRLVYELVSREVDRRRRERLGDPGPYRDFIG